MGGRTLGASTGLVMSELLCDPKTANDRHVMDLTRRPKILASAIFCVDDLAIPQSSSPISLVARGDSAPATRRVGTSASSDQKTASVALAGGPSMTACPLAPPIPELVIAMSGCPLEERTVSGSGSTGTRRRYCDHRMMGLGLERLTLGGMRPVFSIPHTLQSDAKNAVISRCLWRG